MDGSDLWPRQIYIRTIFITGRKRTECNTLEKVAVTLAVLVVLNSVLLSDIRLRSETASVQRTERTLFTTACPITCNHGYNMTAMGPKNTWNLCGNHSSIHFIMMKNAFRNIYQNNCNHLAIICENCITMLCNANEAKATDEKQNRKYFWTKFNIEKICFRDAFIYHQKC